MRKASPTAKKNHGQVKDGQGIEKAEQKKTGNITQKTKNHGLTAAPAIRQSTAWHLKHIDADFPKPDQESDGRKGKTLFQQDEHEKRFEITLVL